MLHMFAIVKKTGAQCVCMMFAIVRKQMHSVCVCVCVWTSWSDKQMTVVTQQKKKPASRSGAYKHCALLVAGLFSWNSWIHGND